MKKLITICCLIFITGAPTFAISKANFKFLDYPGFKDAHSSWGAIGYSSKFDKIIVGVTDHQERVAIYSYDCKKETIELANWVTAGGHIQRYQWQGKIHSQIIENKNDGWLYWGTDGGEDKEEYYMNHPDGYTGGFFMKYNPGTHEIINLGRGRRYESIKDLQIDQVRNRLYGTTYPSAHLIIKDLKTNKVSDKGCLNKAHTGRVVFTDDWGNAYYTDIRGHLVKYEAEIDSLIWSQKPLFSHPKTEAFRIRSGLRAWTRYKNTNDYYISTGWGTIFRFVPQKKGIGKIEELGLILKPSKKYPARKLIGSTAPNITCGFNHKLYTLVAGHGNFIEKDKAVLIEIDPKTKEKKIVYRIPLSRTLEATGSHIIDKKGNIYFASRRKVKKGLVYYGESKAQLIIFNPEKELK